MPSLLCRVKANYAFESNDPSSLSFKEGDIIDVLCKLPSGWWDGWCSGQRGWFPSNYVQIMETYENKEREYQAYFDPSTEEFKEYKISPDLTYEKILTHITSTIHSLISATKNPDSSDYTQYTAIIRRSIRFMMISTGTISKDALIIKEDHVLRAYHRIILNTLSKLTFSSQSNEIDQLVIKSQEILLAVRNFVSRCETMEIELHRVDPILLFPMLDNQTEFTILQQDWPPFLNSTAEYMQDILKSFVSHMLHSTGSENSLSVLLFAQYRNLASLNGQFISLIESVNPCPSLASPLCKDLAVSKHTLYTGFGMLFIKLQSLSNAHSNSELLINQMQTITSSIQEAIQSICKIMTDLIQDSKLSQPKRNSSNLVLSDSTSLSSHSSLPEPTQYDFHKNYSIQNSSDTPGQTESIHPTSIYKNMSSVPLSPPLYKREKAPISLIETPPSPKKSQDSTSHSRKISNVTSSSQTTATEEHSFLCYDYEPNEIVFSSCGHVKGGTLSALIERITLHDFFDMSFSNTFFLTYRSFCTSNEFLDLLETRFNVLPPIGLSEDDLMLWHSKKQKLIRLRVLNVLKIWLEQYYDEQDYSILNRLAQFIDAIRSTNTLSAVQIDRLIQKRKDSCKDMKQLVITQPVDSPEPILPRNLKRLKILDISPIEMARQLTLIDFKLYSSIRPIECLDKAWSRDEEAVNIQKSIRFCNGMTQWVSDEILSQSEVKKRCMVLKYWVDVAERCRQWNNFNTCMAILSAFDNSAIGRLKRTWEMVGGRTHHVVSQLRNLLKANRNFVQYRELVHSINPPCVPFVGIYLQDLTFIEDGNSNFLKPPYADLINFAKRSKTAAVIQEIQQYQMIAYQFRPVDAIQEFICNSMSSSRDEDQLYKESLRLEPKEREDEKITRLLHESGFL